MSNGHKDAQEVSEILTVVSEKIPTLIKSIVEIVFSETSGREMGKAVAAFYEELTKSELPNDVALEMTRDYMKTFSNFGNIVKNIKE